MRASTAYANQPGNGKVDKAAKALEHQRFEAQVKQDYAFLKKVSAADWIYTSSSGKQNAKPKYVQHIGDGKSQYAKIEVEALDICGDGFYPTCGGLNAVGQLMKFVVEFTAATKEAN